jgi:enamidase
MNTGQLNDCLAATAEEVRCRSRGAGLPVDLTPIILFAYKWIIRLDRGARARKMPGREGVEREGKSMAHDESPAAGATKLVIRNIGLLLSGALEKPILDADTIVAENGKITAIGRAKDVDTEGATTVVDANGTTVAPGLIDSHVHPVAGDWTPRQNQIGWIDSYLHGGVTTMISAGEVHMPGRPRDVVGLKAMAIFAQRAFWTLRPGGVKVHAGAPVIETEMVEEDFKELAAAGVKLLGEVGLGGVKDGPTARKMVGWARKYGIQSTIHTGGPSIPGSGLIDKDVVLEADTDVIGHINGGHTALPDDQIRCICEGCKRGLELVHNGNERSALYTLRIAREMGDLNRVILGTDAPAGSGVQPLGILRMVSLLSSLGEVPAEIAFCFATGNTARMRALDCGIIEVGRSADFVIMDRAQHSAGKNILDSVQLGDLPGIGMTIIDGIVRTQRSRNTPPADKVPEIVAH